MKRICVFCGASPGARVSYRQAARALAGELLARGYGLVYGGASVGLMGELATAMLEGGGEVIGVIPQSLVDREVAYQALSDLRVVRSMHERKALMAELADAFIALPGGLGTLEEVFEAWTWAQLGHHAKPCALYNVDGYFDRLLGFLDTVAMEGFLKLAHREMLIVADAIEPILDALAAYTPPLPGKLFARPVSPGRRTPHDHRPEERSS